MNFSFHNQLIIKTRTKNYIFYNTILNSTLDKLSNFEKYNEYLSIGNGTANQESQNIFHLSNKLLTTKLVNSSFQSDISKGNLFAKYEFIVSKNEINENYITEIGLSNNDNNPVIYNYFSLISNDTPNGIYIQNENEIVFEVTINLTINENNTTNVDCENNTTEIHKEDTSFDYDFIEDGECCQTCAFEVIGETDDAWSESGEIMIEPCKSCKHNIPPISEEYENAPSHYVSLKNLHYKEKE